MVAAPKSGRPTVDHTRQVVAVVAAQWDGPSSLRRSASLAYHPPGLGIWLGLMLLSCLLSQSPSRRDQSSMAAAATPAFVGHLCASASAHTIHGVHGMTAGGATCT